jgi:O-antigen/teichoic acid export membrane protein
MTPPSSTSYDRSERAPSPARPGLWGHALRLVWHPTTIALADQVVASATNFLAGVIIARLCSKEQFGMYSIGSGILFFANHIQNSLVSTPYTVYSPRTDERAAPYYEGSTLIIQVLVSFVTAALVFLGAMCLFLGETPTEGLHRVVLAIGFSLTMILFRQYERRLCFAKLQMTTALAVDLVVCVMQIGGLFLLVWTDCLSAALAYIVMGAACVPVTVHWLIHARKRLAFRFSDIGRTFLRHWLLGKWLLASGLVILMATNAYPWFLLYFQGAEATATFGACLGIVLLINPLIVGISNVLDPLSSRAYAENGLKELNRVMTFYTILLATAVGAFSLLLFVFGGPLVVLIYGDKYAGLGAVVGVLNLSNLATILAVPVGSALVATEQSRIHVRGSVCALLVTLIAGPWMVITYKIMGAAIALSAAATASFLVRWLAFRRQRRFTPERILGTP